MNFSEKFTNRVSDDRLDELAAERVKIVEDRDKMPVWVRNLLWWVVIIVVVAGALIAYAVANHNAETNARDYVNCVSRNINNTGFCDT